MTKTDNEKDWCFSILNNSSKDRDRLYAKLDSFQKEYCESIMQFPVIMVDQPAGTGKTTIAVMKALDMLRYGAISRIVYIRFPDARYGKLGFMKGYQDEKEAPLMGPFYDACAECGLQAEVVDSMIENGMIKLGTDIGYRGCNIKNSFVIIDEAQNGTIEDLQLMLTRIHDKNCKCLVIGHSGQCDSKLKLYGKRFNAFQVYQIHMDKQPFTKICTLPINYRGKISLHADNIYQTIQEIENQ